MSKRPLAAIEAEYRSLTIEEDELRDKRRRLDQEAKETPEYQRRALFDSLGMKPSLKELLVALCGGAEVDALRDLVHELRAWRDKAVQVEAASKATKTVVSVEPYLESDDTDPQGRMIAYKKITYSDGSTRNVRV